MADSLPSRTSILVAAGRVMGAREPDPTMRNPDHLAEKLLGPEEIALIQEHPISVAVGDRSGARPAYEAMGTAVMMLVRTKYIDEKLEQAIDRGATQVVILGAGFDTRAYRFAEKLKNVRVFEIDSETTQNYKRKRAEAALGPPPPNLTYVTVDFNRDQLDDVLARGGYQNDQQTFFTWEGVSMYVAEEGVRQTLRTIAHAAPGSTLIMDYTTQAVLDFMAKFPEFGPAKFLASWGEPWIFGLPDGKEREFFTEAGLEPREFFSIFSPESVKRYLTRPDGTIVGMSGGDPPRPQLPAEAQSAASVLAKNGSSFYTLAELAVPSGKS